MVSPQAGGKIMYDFFTAARLLQSSQTKNKASNQNMTCIALWRTFTERGCWKFRRTPFTCPYDRTCVYSHLSKRFSLNRQHHMQNVQARPKSLSFRSSPYLCCSCKDSLSTPAEKGTALQNYKHWYYESCWQNMQDARYTGRKHKAAFELASLVLAQDYSTVPAGMKQQHIYLPKISPKFQAILCSPRTAMRILSEKGYSERRNTSSWMWLTYSL